MDSLPTRMKSFCSSSGLSLGLIFLSQAYMAVAENLSHVCDNKDPLAHIQPLLEVESASVVTPETDDPWFIANTATSDLGNYDNFWDKLECSAIFDEGPPRPIHPMSTWMLLRGVYYGVVGPHQSTIDYTQAPLDGVGFLVPVTVENVPGKGRAVIAAEDIPKGTLVWDSTFTARFPSPLYFRRFLSTLPIDLACDVMIWAYVEDFAWDGKYDSNVIPTISVDLDEGALFNSVYATKGEEKNISCKPWKATRLILKGEELLVDYSEFEKEFSWTAAGFGSEDEAEWGSQP